MMRKMPAFALVVAGLCGGATGAGAQAALEDARALAPGSPWTLDFAEERCSLIREFADGEGKVRLQVDAFGPGPGYRVMISGDPVPQPFNVPILEIRVGYSPDRAEREQFYASAGTFGEDYAVSFRSGFLPEGPADARAAQAFARSVEHLSVQFDLRKPVRLETGNMAAPLQAMDKCVDDLLLTWGIEPETYRTQSRPARLVAAPEDARRYELAQPSAYPGPAERRARRMAESMARAGELVPVRVMIGADGRATHCVVQVQVASEARRQAICQTLAGPYEPALDASGVPTASFVQWETR